MSDTRTATDLVSRYLAAWNEPHPTARRAAIASVFHADARYVDPMADVTGTDALDAAIAGVQGQFPGFEFTALQAADAHHDVIRFWWGLGPAGAEPIVTGFDVAVIEDGRIRTVLGFLDKVPAAA
jgi:hypothetical protein